MDHLAYEFGLLAKPIICQECLLWPITSKFFNHRNQRKQLSFHQTWNLLKNPSISGYTCVGNLIKLLLQAISKQ